MSTEGKITAIRAVAIFEAVKGVLVLVTALALFRYLHIGAQHVADQIARHFVLNPASHYPRIIHQAIEHPEDLDLTMLSLGTVLYATVRFVEAYGLWHEKNWAWVFGVLSAGIYIPFEIYHFTQHQSWVGVVILLINILIVVALWRGRRVVH
jgi:uncharacterized membrane protein (DUF2068 family)